MVASCHIKLIVLPRAPSAMKKARARGGSGAGSPKPISRSSSSRSVSGVSTVSAWSISLPDSESVRSNSPSKAPTELDSETSSQSSGTLF